MHDLVVREALSTMADDAAERLRELVAAGAAGAYLEAAALEVPVEPRARAELAALAFLARLWESSTDFSLDPQRLDSSIDEVEAGGEPAADEIEVVVPVRGLQLPVERLEL